MLSSNAMSRRLDGRVVATIASLAVSTLVLTLLPPVASHGQESRELTIDPDPVAEGGTFTVVGECPEAEAGEQLPILTGEAEEGDVLGHATVEADGTFIGDASAPETSPPATGLIHVACGDEEVTITGELTVAEASLLDSGCRESAREANPFDDVAEEATHAGAISCLWAYGITTGTFEGGQVYEPADTVTREQMASFIAAAIDTVTEDVYSLPESEADAERWRQDDISDAHRINVDRLTEAGIVEGYADGTFRPAELLNRAQMASFIVAAVEQVTGEELEREVAFEDVSGVHQPNIEKLAAIGVTTGTGEATFDPQAPITRAQMASFLARTLGYLVEEGLLQPFDVDLGTSAARLGIVELDHTEHEGFDRLVLMLDGDDGEAGWRVRYVDDARSAGSGEPLDVEGDATLQISLTGMAYPGDLPEDVEESRWEEDRITLGGQAIQELVNDEVFEGQQELFIGTTGVHRFEVTRLDDPQRLVVDVHHAS